eukprot:3862945-Rhodomonas_salina.3
MRGTEAAYDARSRIGVHRAIVGLSPYAAPLRYQPTPVLRCLWYSSTGGSVLNSCVLLRCSAMRY